MKKGVLIFVSILGSVCVAIILVIGGSGYMKKKTIEKEYQQGVKLIQDYVTDYLVENYEGIEKIEWQGIGVEYRNSPILGPSLFGNYVNTIVRVYISEDTYFSMYFSLSEEVEYDDNLHKYVKLRYLNPQNADSAIQSGLRNEIHKLSPSEKEYFKDFKKSPSGSKKAKVVYNLDIHELTY
ncbi:hypothetical protein AALM99_11660 [Lactococcus muris]|uniref:Lipoprotein n=1 Tax=Lactococcus muris TaxID=2941330 RepID=A0ABV4DDP6_9LACT